MGYVDILKMQILSLNACDVYIVYNKKCTPNMPTKKVGREGPEVEDE